MNWGRTGTYYFVYCRWRADIGRKHICTPDPGLCGIVCVGVLPLSWTLKSIVSFSVEGLHVHFELPEIQDIVTADSPSRATFLVACRNDEAASQCSQTWVVCRVS